MEEAAGEASEKWLEERKEREPFGHSVSFEIVSKKKSHPDVKFLLCLAKQDFGG